MQPNAEKPGALTVVKKEGGAFKLDEELLERVLKRPDVANKKVCVISIAGAYREGKSFLMNFLLRYLDQLSRSPSMKGEGDWMESGSGDLTGFKWQGGPDAVTEGILLWSEPFILRDKKGEVAIFLMDTQGIYDRDSTNKNYTTIFALSTLLSSVTIYNLTKLINENHLQQMRLFTEIAQVAMEKYNAEKPFQRLMFLIRDWSSPTKHAFGLEGGRNYLDEELKIRSNQKPDEQKKPESQKVREYIKSSFEKIECFLMPYPGPTVAEWDSGGDLKLADIDERFKKQLQVLMPHLLTQITPNRVYGESITCAELFDYLQDYCVMLEGGELPDPKSMVEMLAEAHNKRAVEAALTRYTAEMKKLCGDGRPYVANLRTEHKRLKGEAIALFNDTKKIADAEYSDKYRAQLEKDIEEEYEKFEKSNGERAQAQNSEALDKARTLYWTEMEKLCGGGRPFVANLRTEHDRLKGKAMDLFDDRKPHGSTLSDMYRASLEEKIEEEYEKFEKSNNFNEDRVRAHNKRAVKEARNSYEHKMVKLCGDDRPYVAKLYTEHERLKGEAMALFNDNKTGDSGTYRALLEKKIEGAYKKFEKSNKGKKTLGDVLEGLFS